MFFIAPPKAPAWKVALYGLLIGVGQFGALFIAIDEGFRSGCPRWSSRSRCISPSSRLGHPRRAAPPDAGVGAAVGFAGMAVIGSERLAGASLGPFLMEMLAARVLGGGQRGREKRAKGRHARLHRLVEPRRAASRLSLFRSPSTDRDR